jgi:putative addiction module component (TIGR02574 family)
MSTAAKAVAEILTLAPEERAQALSLIWDSLAQSEDAVPVPDWQLRIIDERLAADDAGTSDGESWADLRRRIESEP